MLHSALVAAPLHSLEEKPRAIAAPRVQMLARHVLQSAVALIFGGVPVKALPVLADQRLKAVSGGKADADTVGPIRVEVSIQVVGVTSFHRGVVVAILARERADSRRGIAIVGRARRRGL